MDEPVDIIADLRSRFPNATKGRVFDAKDIVTSIVGPRAGKAGFVRVPVPEEFFTDPLKTDTFNIGKTRLYLIILEEE